MRESVLDGRLQVPRTEPVEQAQESQGDRTEIAAACRRAHEQFLARRHCVGEPIGAAMLSRSMLPGDEGSDMAGIFDLCCSIVAAWMVGDHP